MTELPLRLVSHTEIEELFRCQARHDFRYGDQLAGSSLKPKHRADVLKEGSAWGAGVFAWHATGDIDAARWAMAYSLSKEARRLKKLGLFLRDPHRETWAKLRAILDHYATTAPYDRLNVVEAERRFEVPLIPGMAFEAYLDGLEASANARLWLVEFKLRGQLSSFDAIERAPQIRRYAWAFREATGIAPAGVIVDERVNGLPDPEAPVAWINPKTKADPRNADGKMVGSRQSCTAAAYLEACRSIGQTPDPEKADELTRKHDPRQWHARHRLRLTTAELDEAGRELKSAAKLIRALDERRLYPVRNPGWGARNCSGCPFADPCLELDEPVIDALFDRVPAKRNRPPKEIAA